MIRSSICHLSFTALFISASLLPTSLRSEEASAAPTPKPTPLPQLEAEEIADARVSGTKTGRLFIAPNEDGSADLLQIYYPDYGGRADLFIADLGSGHTEWLKFEPRPERNIFHLAGGVVAPNGKLFISLLVTSPGVKGLRQRVAVYDPKTNHFDLHAVKAPDTIWGESHPISLGPDGLVYFGGRHPEGSVTLISVNPETLEVKDYGVVEDLSKGKPTSSTAYSMASDDRFTYIVCGKLPWRLVAIDRETGKGKEILSQPDSSAGHGISIRHHLGGCLVLVREEKKPIRHFFLRHGELTLRETEEQAPPWTPVEQKPNTWTSPQIAELGRKPDFDGNAAIWWRPAPEGTPADAPAIVKVNNVENRTEEGWRKVEMKVPLYEVNLVRVRETGDGRIFGTSSHFNGAFLYDPKSGTTERMGSIGVSHYSTTEADGKLYLSGYPNSPLFEYDYRKPWTAGGLNAAGAPLHETAADSNPRLVTRLTDSRVHKMYGAATGSDGRVYFGGRRMRNGSIGGIGWYDPKTREKGGLWEEISNYHVTHLCAAGDEIVISAARVEDKVLNKPKPEQGALFFLSTKDQKLIHKLEPFPKIVGPGPIVSDGKGLVIGWTPGETKESPSHLYSVDLATHTVKKVVETRYRLPEAIGDNQQGYWDFRMGPDGHVWTFMAGAILRIHPETLEIEQVGRAAPGAIGRIAFSGNDLYVINGPALRVYRGIVPTP